jgi:hypothetical protein
LDEILVLVYWSRALTREDIQEENNAGDEDGVLIELGKYAAAPNEARDRQEASAEASTAASQARGPQYEG